MKPVYHVIITTIFPPTKAVKDFAKRPDCRLYAAGDRKTPADWHCENTRFLSAEEQRSMDSEVARLLPWNHYCRKLMGYIQAIRDGATYIVDTDDDNIPMENWDFPAFEGEFEVLNNAPCFINIYKAFTKQRIWPRGFPLECLREPNSEPTATTKAAKKIGIWQGLADGDPDVDAIYRLTDGTECIFDKRAPLVLGQGQFCPFNSQNTAFTKAAFPLLYLPAFVTFRFTDILRGLVAQPILAVAGLSLGFTEATVFQERNPHNYLKDFESEIPCYLHPVKVIKTVTDAVSPQHSVAENLLLAYRALQTEKIVETREIELLEAWIRDLQKS